MAGRDDADFAAGGDQALNHLRPGERLPRSWWSLNREQAVVEIGSHTHGEVGRALIVPLDEWRRRHPRTARQQEVIDHAIAADVVNSNGNHSLGDALD